MMKMVSTVMIDENPNLVESTNCTIEESRITSIIHKYLHKLIHYAKVIIIVLMNHVQFNYIIKLIVIMEQYNDKQYNAKWIFTVYIFDIYKHLFQQ